MAVTDYDRAKPLDVASASGTPSVSKTQPIYLLSGDDSTTGTGQIVIDWTNVSGASDIAVYDQNDSLLAYEIEALDTTNETGVLWVYNDWVRDGSTQAKVVYGNGPASSEENQTGTWDNTGQNALGVWHLSDTSGPMEDSTANTNDAEVVNATLDVGGQFDAAADFNGTDAKLQFGDYTLTQGNSQLTVVAWPNWDAIASTSGNNPAVFSQGSGFDDYWNIRFTGISDELHFGVETNGDRARAAYATSNLSTSQWYQTVLSFDSGTVEGYVDASSVGTGSMSTETALSSNYSLSNGDHNMRAGVLAWQSLDSDQHMDGQIDELRLYSDAKGSDWVQADWDASAEASQVFFDQDAAVGTGDGTGETDTAIITSASASPITATETATSSDGATITAVAGTSLTAADTTTASDTATVTAATASPLTSTEGTGSQETDTAVITTATATPQTSTDTSSATDAATTTAVNVSPLTSTETAVNEETDSAIRTAATASAITSADSATAADSATLTSATATPQTSTDTASAADGATVTSATAAPLTASEVTGALGDLSDVVTVTLAWSPDATHQLTWSPDATVQLSMSDNTIRQQSVPVEGETIERTIEIDDDGSDKNIQGATVEWYIVPNERADDSEAILAHDDSGVTVTIADGSAGEISLSVDDDASEGLSGYYRQRLSVVDSSGVEQRWTGAFEIAEW